MTSLRPKYDKPLPEVISQRNGDPTLTRNYTKELYYSDVIMSAMASQITSLTIVYTTVYSTRRSKKTSTVYSGTDQRRLARADGSFWTGERQRRSRQFRAACTFTKKTSKLRVWPVNSRHNGPVTRKMFPFDDVIMTHHTCNWCISWSQINRMRCATSSGTLDVHHSLQSALSNSIAHSWVIVSRAADRCHKVMSPNPRSARSDRRLLTISSLPWQATAHASLIAANPFSQPSLFKAWAIHVNPTDTRVSNSVENITVTS